MEIAARIEHLVELAVSVCVYVCVGCYICLLCILKSQEPEVTLALSHADTHPFPVADVLLPLLTLLSEPPRWTPVFWWPPFLWGLVVSHHSQTPNRAAFHFLHLSHWLNMFVLFFLFLRNADTLGSFWRNWNVPFQRWIQRSVTQINSLSTEQSISHFHPNLVYFFSWSFPSF